MSYAFESAVADAEAVLDTDAKPILEQLVLGERRRDAVWTGTVEPES